MRQAAFFIFLALFFSVNSLKAKVIEVNPQQDLQKQLDQTTDGDKVVLLPGQYIGNFVIENAITLSSKTGPQQTIIDAQGSGHALVLSNNNITIENLTIVNWGNDLTLEHSAIYSKKSSNKIKIKNNQLRGDGFGIWLQKGQDIEVINNTIEGNLALRSADRGNGIQLSIIKNALVKGNETFHVRDGIYIISSQNNTIIQNTMHDLRYGIHYMYSHHNKVIENLAYNTRAGYALMSSRHLEVRNNTTFHSEDYGFLINFITSSDIIDNIIEDVWTKPENKVLGRDGKGLFVYNSAYNNIKGNVIYKAEIGIHLTAGSENTKVVGNSFIDNPIQVKYVSNKKQEWSENGKGNYWSNYLGWDINNDTIGDVIFEPNDGIDKLVWQYPEMKMLLDSPAVLILRWIQKQFPILKPPGVKDSYPLMAVPKRHQQVIQQNSNKFSQITNAESNTRIN